MLSTFEPRYAVLNPVVAPGLLILLLATTVLPQSPTPTPNKRDLGLQSNTASGSQTDQTKSKEARPELVLQTGYNNFFGATRLRFSPDGRLLATASFSTNTIKLWETATGLELCDLSTSGQHTTSPSPGLAFSLDKRVHTTAGSRKVV